MVQSFWQIPKKTLITSSLRNILIVLMVIQICVPVALVGWLSMRNGRQSVDILVEQVYQQAIEQIQDHLDSYFALPPYLNEINLAAKTLGFLPLDDFETLGHYFWQQMQIMDVSYINYASEDGAFIGVERLATGSFLIQETLESDLHRFTTYETNRLGDRASSQSVIDTSRIQDEGWYAAAAAAGQPVWSEIYQWADQPDVLSLSSSYPVYDGQGQLQGVMGVDLSLSDIGAFLKQINISPNSQLYILERNGDVVASSTNEAIYALDEERVKRLNIATSRNLSARQIGQVLGQQTSEAPVYPSATVQPQFGNYIVAVVPWQNEHGLDWLIVSVIPKAEFMSQIWANTRFTVILGVMALMMAIWCASLTARWVTVTLRDLNLAAAAVADGQFESAYLHRKPRWLPLSIREVQGLNRSFYLMTLQLRSTFRHMARINSTLEERVNLRTVELQQSEAKLKTSLQEKEVLLKEIHHRVKNNLHVVANLLDLQSDYIQDEKGLSMLVDSQNRLQTMALIHEQLYQSKDLGEINFQSYIHRLIENLVSSHQEATLRIAIHYDIHEIYLNLETAIPCGLLINELVTNAIKHAFPNRKVGIISIHFKPTSSGLLQLTVADQGVGIDPEAFSHQSSSFGLKLIQILARQLKSEVKLDAESGTSFQFLFQELAYRSRV